MAMVSMMTESNSPPEVRNIVAYGLALKHSASFSNAMALFSLGLVIHPSSPVKSKTNDFNREWQFGDLEKECRAIMNSMDEANGFLFPGLRGKDDTDVLPKTENCALALGSEKDVFRILKMCAEIAELMRQFADDGKADTNCVSKILTCGTYLSALILGLALNQVKFGKSTLPAPKSGISIH